MRYTYLLLLCTASLTLSAQNYALDTTFFVRNAVHDGNNTYLLGIQDKKGVVLKLSKALRLDTVCTLSSNQSLMGFHELFIDRNGNICIVFESLKTLFVNDSVVYNSDVRANNLISITSLGSIRWHRHFRYTGYSTGKFSMADNKRQLALGMDTDGRIIVDHDTVSQHNSYGNTVVLMFDQHGKLTESIDFSRIYTSSTFYGFYSYQRKPLAMTISSVKGNSTPGRQLQQAHGSNVIAGNFVQIPDTLQLIDLVVKKKQLYLLTWQDYILRGTRKKIKKISRIYYFAPPGTKRHDTINHKMLFDNGDYLTYVRYFEHRPDGKQWNNFNSLTGVSVVIRHLHKKSLAVIEEDEQYISGTRNWVTITHCNKKTLEVVVDGKFMRIGSRP